MEIVIGIEEGTVYVALPEAPTPEEGRQEVESIDKALEAVRQLAAEEMGEMPEEGLEAGPGMAEESAAMEEGYAE